MLARMQEASFKLKKVRQHDNKFKKKIILVFGSICTVIIYESSMAEGVAYN